MSVSKEDVEAMHGRIEKGMGWWGRRSFRVVFWGIVGVLMLVGLAGEYACSRLCPGGC